MKNFSIVLYNFDSVKQVTPFKASSYLFFLIYNLFVILMSSSIMVI